MLLYIAEVPDKCESGSPTVGSVQLVHDKKLIKYVLEHLQLYFHQALISNLACLLRQYYFFEFNQKCIVFIFFPELVLLYL